MRWREHIKIISFELFSGSGHQCSFRSEELEDMQGSSRTGLPQKRLKGHMNHCKTKWDEKCKKELIYGDGIDWEKWLVTRESLEIKQKY